MLHTPILFLIFNRPDLTEQVFATIKQAQPKQLFIAADGPRQFKEGEAQLCEQARAIVLKNINWDCEVHTLLREENLGCKIAVSQAITWFFDNVEQGIILEDDILPNKSFYRFCEEMLIKYKDNEMVTQVSGVNLMGEYTENEDSYFFSKLGGIWGWATWRRAWKNYDVNIESWGDKATKRQVASFLENKNWFNKIKINFDCVFNKQLDTWDYQWVLTQMKLRGLAVIPNKNLIVNIGFREDATHTKNRNELIESKMKANEISFPLSAAIKIFSSHIYTSYYFSLLPNSKKRIFILFDKVKSKIKQWL